jgi:hypothetical protein
MSRLLVEEQGSRQSTSKSSVCGDFSSVYGSPNIYRGQYRGQNAANMMSTMGSGLGSGLGSSAYFDNKKIFDTPRVDQYGSHMVMSRGGNLDGGGGGGGGGKLYVSLDTRFSNNIGSDAGAGAGGGSGGTADANYNFVLPIRLTNIQSMSVTNIEIPISYYNISANLGNNTFRVTRVASGNVWTVSLSDGQYTATKLQTMVNAGLPPGLTFSTNANGQSVFTNTDISGSNYYVEFYTDTFGGYDKNNPKFKLGWIMGFRYIAYPISAGGGSLVSECILNLNGPRYLYLVVDEFQNGKENSFNSALGDIGMMKKNILARVATSYHDYPYGTILPANLSNGALTSDCRTYFGGGRSVDIQRLNVQLVNEIGQVMDLRGDHIMFCLEFDLGG